MRIALVIAVSLTLVACHAVIYPVTAIAQAPVPPNEEPPIFPAIAAHETHRIRITNAVSGLIQVSMNQGDSWSTVGMVTAPATDSLTGYLASGYSKPSTVCATAIHGLRIRVGDLSSAYPRLINVVPKEFAQTPKLFGGHVSGTSGIYTDISVGTSIFRNLAPHAGDKVYIQTPDDGLQSLPLNYQPRENDVIVIIVRAPDDPLNEVVFENVQDGAVTVRYASGTQSLVAHVLKPLLGIGRFDGTSYTGVGAINTNHTGVITVSTAPITKSKQFEGDGPERRGGFQIEPAYHNSQSDEAGAPMILVIGDEKKKHRPDLEGKPPLFDGYLDLAWDPSDVSKSWIAQIARDHGTHHWVSMPELIGNKPNALVGVTAIRLVKKVNDDRSWLTAQLQHATSQFQASRLAIAKRDPSTVERGKIVLNANVTGSDRVVSFFVDGELVAITNTAPYRTTYDTSKHSDGECVIEVKSANENGDTVAISRSMLYIDNKHRIKGS